LMLSGIGERDHLAKFGVPLVHHNPHVGQHLQDHLMLCMLWGIGNVTDGQSPSINPKEVESLGNLYDFLLKRDGPFTSNGLEATAFINTGARKDLQGAPDLQLHFISTLGQSKDLVNMNFNSTYRERYDQIAWPQYGFTICPTLLHPKSEGRVQLKSSDPLAHAEIDPNYLDDFTDIQLFQKGIDVAFGIVDTPAMKKYQPIDLVDKFFSENPYDRYKQSSKFWEFHIRGGAITVYHPTSTCRMSSTPETGVVDGELKVHGVSNLRVVDASVLPFIVSGNTNAPTIAVAEKASAMIRESWRL